MPTKKIKATKTPTKTPTKTIKTPPPLIAPDPLDAIELPSRGSRRWFARLALSFCAFVIGWLALFGGGDSALHQTIVWAVTAFGGGVASFYMGGSIADYRKALDTIAAMGAGRK